MILQSMKLKYWILMFLKTPSARLKNKKEKAPLRK